MNGDIRPPKKVQDFIHPPVQTNKRETLPTSSPPSNVPLGIDVTLSENSPKSRKLHINKWMILAAGGVLALLIVTIVSWVWYTQQLSATNSGSDEKTKITIPSGTNTEGIANILKKNELIRSQAAFMLYIRLVGKGGELQSGAYRLAKSDDVPAIVNHLVSGETDTFSITFIPGATLAKHRKVLIKAGYSAEQVDAALAKQYDHPLLNGKPAGSDLEGYIYGETYQFPADATPEQILARTFDQFYSVVQKEKLVELYQKRGFSLYQGITLASIIEREIANPVDAAQVAQVFELRLSRGMNLGSDVTYQYIADKTGQARSVDIDSPYNTRRYPGLPPGPISSPSKASLIAVGNPAAGDFLYFISGDDDKMYYARTNEEHEQNITNHCQKKCQIT